MGQRIDTPLLREVIRDRPFAYWPLDDFNSGTNFDPKEVYSRFSLARQAAGFSWQTQSLIRGDPRFIEFFGGVYLAGGTGSPYSPHAGASGLMSAELIIKPGALNNSTMLISKGSGSNYEYTLQYQANGAIQWSVFTSAGSNVADLSTPAGILTVGRPRIVVVTFDRAKAIATIMVDGMEQARITSMSGNSSAVGAAFQVGHRADAGGATLGQSSPAGVGHLSLYDYVLSTARAQAHARAFQHGPRPFR